MRYEFTARRHLQGVIFLLALVVLSSCGLRPAPPRETPDIVRATPQLEVEETPLETGSVKGGSVLTKHPEVEQTPLESGSVEGASLPSRPTTLKSVLQAQEPPEASPPVADLARSLVKGLDSDEDKAHALYRWLGENVAYDVPAAYADAIDDQSPDRVLRTRKAVCAGYADLFHAMCGVVGLESRVIPGRSRTESMDLPPRLRNSDTNHAWNAVKVGGRWRLLDPTWGAGHVNEAKQFVRDPNDDWFLVKPEVFIYTHLPQEADWQLLPSPVSRENFEHLPKIKPLFFDLGFELVEPERQPVECDGEVEFRVRSTKGNFVSALVTAQNRKLEQTSVLSQNQEGEFRVRVRLPVAGEYEVNLMGRRAGEQTSQDVATFKVVATAGISQGFPQTYLTFEERHAAILAGTDGVLVSNTPARLSFRVPGAEKVYLRNGEDTVAMDRQGESFSLNYTPERGELQVMGSFPGDGNKIWGLAAYRVR